MKYTKFSKKQLTAMFWWLKPSTKNHKAIVCDGSVRSGKSISMTVGFVFWSMENFDGESFAFCGKTIESLKRNIITPMHKWLEGICTIKENISKNYIEITMNGKSNRYYVFGGKDESSYQLIQDITLAGILCDEVALMARSFVEQAVTRCSVSGSRLWFNCNPESSEHWFYKEWILKSEDKNALHLHFMMEDNFSLAQETKDMYERSFSGVFYDRYIKGLWVLAEGLVYPMFNRGKHILEEYSPSSYAEYYISIDYGTLNPCSMGLWAVESDKAVRIDEYYYDGRSKGVLKTDEEYYQALESLADGRKIRYVIIDPSASSFITCIRRHGKFVVRQARNSVIDGIRETATLISSGRILICKSCKGILKEFALYRWDERSAEDKVIKEHDHAMDEMRYFCYTILRNKLRR